MPEQIVCWELPLSFTEPSLVRPVGQGGWSPPSGSLMDVKPVAGAGWNAALLLFCTPPTTSMAEAVTWALPAADRAEVEPESTTTGPGMLMLALPERVSAPEAVALRTKIEGRTDTLIVVGLVRKLASPP
jgi:hypothetical protein